MSAQFYSIGGLEPKPNDRFEMTSCAIVIAQTEDERQMMN